MITTASSRYIEERMAKLHAEMFALTLASTMLGDVPEGLRAMAARPGMDSTLIYYLNKTASVLAALDK